jgi:hypothetical protein
VRDSASSPERLGLNACNEFHPFNTNPNMVTYLTSEMAKGQNNPTKTLPLKTLEL